MEAGSSLPGGATYLVRDFPEERVWSRALPSAPGRKLIA